MITTSGAPRHLLRWSIVAVALLVGYLAGLVLLGLAARPGPELPGRLAAYEDPRAWWPIAVQVGLGAAGPSSPTGGRAAGRTGASPSWSRAAWPSPPSA